MKAETGAARFAEAAIGSAVEARDCPQSSLADLDSLEVLGKSTAKSAATAALDGGPEISNGKS